ncbi:glycosyltransferase family 2 protein [Fusicatenibacter saccharivorans]|uniref:glycosyltransferase family 2 protein n=1 Tax=Fusicatenibacter saccharivorans TaxID=1150298 RepID=UPI003D073662
MAEVSMIVPVYQVEKYIAQCIESVLNQTFQDFELILIDDGSKDQSGRICDLYAAKDDRILVIHTENRGAAAARNVGLDHASGRYITFLDGDDYLDEHMIARLYEEIVDSEYDMVVCDFLNLLPDEEDNFIVHLQEKTVNGREVLEHLKNERNYGLWTIVWNKIYKREVLENLRFPDGKYFEDEFFSNQLYLNSNQIHVIPDVLCYHRVLASSTMNTQKIENYLDLLDALQERLDIYFKYDYSEDEIYKVLIFLLDPFTKCVRAKFSGTNKKRVEQTRRFIKIVSRRLMGKNLSFVKKSSLVIIGLFPDLMYRIAIRFRSQLEKFL